MCNTKLIFVFLIHFILSKLVLLDKLRFVFGIFRHGARAPWKSLDSNSVDLIGNKWEGESQLTGVGMRQQYLLGYKNRNKYFSQLNISNYSPSEVAFFSTETDRTIMSVYSELFGMFPPGTGPKLTEEQKNFAIPPIKNFDFSEKSKSLKDDAIQNQVNPLPVRTFDKNAKYFGLYDPKVCNTVEKYQNDNKNSEKFLNYSQTIINDYGDKMIKLVNKTDVNELKKYETMYFVFDTFMSNYIDGRDLSKVKDVGLEIDKFYHLTVDFLTWDQFYINYGDKEMFIGRLSFSPIMKYLLDLIDSRIKLEKINDKVDYYDPINPKILLYSGHDTSLAALNVFFKSVFGDKIKDYYTYFASSFYVELYKNTTNVVLSENIENDYYLNVLYNEENIFGGPMNYRIFKEKTQDKLVSTDEINKFCKFESDDKSPFLLIMILLVLLLSIIILGFVISKFVKKSKEFIDKQSHSSYSNI